MTTEHSPELLAPAGGLSQLEAAVHAGADAVYFGLERGFNARRRATGIAADALEAVMEKLHRHGRKGYLALNTLVFDEELPEVEEQIRHAARCGVDALIVQDIGLARLARAVAPALPLHASTQMSITDAEGVAFAQSLGLSRVVLGRELSIEEIAAIAAETEVELEVFVHGALCVSYSGQCFSSEAWGGRSANRGQCAQSCRLPYGLLAAGQSTDEEELMIDRDTRRGLAQIFSRGQDERHDGLTPGFLLGSRHQELVIGRNPRHRGLHLGRVEVVLADGVRLRLHNPVKPGDGVVFDGSRPQQHEPGGHVHRIEHRGERVREEIDRGEVVLRFGPGFRATDIAPGDHVWRTRDAASDRGPVLRPAEAVRLPLRIELNGAAGEPLRIRLTTPDGRQTEAASRTPLQTADRRPLDEAALKRAIGELGDTPFRIARWQLDLPDGLFLPLGEIKQTRRAAVEALLEQMTRHQRDRELASAPVLPVLLPEVAPPSPPTQPALSLLCRTAEQVKAALALDDIDEIQVDFLEVHGLKDACQRIRAAGRRLVVAAPRIFKPGEQRLVRYLLHLQPDALLVRSAGLLQRLHALGGAGAAFDEAVRIPTLYGDFSLNASNRLSAHQLLDLGLARLAPTHDLNARQIAALATGLPEARRACIEVVAHQHLPIFHTEHCAFARFLSTGNDYRDCGRPCERHRVHLRDPKGQDHLLLADVGCRNTLFNAQAQSAAGHLADLLAAGIRHYRIELVDEPGDQVAAIVAGYRALLDGRLSATALLHRLQQVPDANGRAQGVGSGSLAVRVEPPRTAMKRPTAR